MTADEFRDGEVPVVSVGAIVDPGEDGVIPAVVLDPARRPDVADLVRVQASDGVGDLRCGMGVWDLGDPEAWLVRVEVSVDHPVTCRFHYVLPLAGNEAWLRSAAAAGGIALGTGDPEGRWLVVTVDPARLGPVLGLLGET